MEDLANSLEKLKLSCSRLVILFFNVSLVSFNSIKRESLFFFKDQKYMQRLFSENNFHFENESEIVGLIIYFSHQNLENLINRLIVLLG